VPLTILASLQLLAQTPVGEPPRRAVSRTRIRSDEWCSRKVSCGSRAPNATTLQAANQLQVGTSESSLTRGANLLWDSGKITSDASVFVDYAGRQRCRGHGT